MSNLEDPLAALDPTLERSFRGHRSAITSISFHPELIHVASASTDSTLHIWNFKPTMRALKLTAHEQTVYGIKHTPNGRFVCSVGADCTLRMTVPTVRGSSVAVKAHFAPIRSVDVANTAPLILTTSDDKSAKIWHYQPAAVTLKAPSFRASLVGHSNWIRSGTFSADGGLIATAADDRSLRIWDTNTHRCTQTYVEPAMPLRAVRFSGDSCLVGGGGDECAVQLWDTRSNQLIQHYANAHSQAITSLAFHPTQPFILTVSLDGTVKVWDIREGAQLYTLHGHTSGVHAATFSANGEYFATGGEDTRLLVWKTNFDRQTATQITGPSPHSLPLPVHHSSASVNVPSTRIHRSHTTSVAPTMSSVADDSNTVSYECAMQHEHDGDDEKSRSTMPAKSRGNAINASMPASRVSDELTLALQQIVGQLDVMSMTLSALDARMQLQEDKISRIEETQRDFSDARHRQEYLSNERSIAASTAAGSDGSVDESALNTD